LFEHVERNFTAPVARSASPCRFTINAVAVTR
jgi:hypothetical protein